MIDVLERPLPTDAHPAIVANRHQNVEDVKAILPLTQSGLDFNPRFTAYALAPRPIPRCSSSPPPPPAVDQRIR